jgi:hypothetical protein
VYRFDSKQSINVLASDRLYHYIGIMCYVHVYCLLMINHNSTLNLQFRSSSSILVSTRKRTGKTSNYCEGVISECPFLLIDCWFLNILYANVKV